jgi:hypothetical protein
MESPESILLKNGNREKNLFYLSFTAGTMATYFRAQCQTLALPVFLQPVNLR